jgi:hypothetical protein
MPVCGSGAFFLFLSLFGLDAGTGTGVEGHCDVQRRHCASQSVVRSGRRHDGWIRQRGSDARFGGLPRTRSSAAAESSMTSVAAEAGAEVGADEIMSVAVSPERVCCFRSVLLVSSRAVVVCCRLDVRVEAGAPSLFSECRWSSVGVRANVRCRNKYL